MSLPTTELIRKLNIQSALTTVITLMKVVPGGKYVLMAGTGLVAAIAGFYLWGDKIWKWISGQQAPQVNNIPKTQPPPKATSQVTEQPDKYLLLVALVDKKQRASIKAWEAMTAEWGKFVAVYKKAPYSLSVTAKGQLAKSYNDLVPMIEKVAQEIQCLDLC
jgi:hypothetical protein